MYLHVSANADSSSNTERQKTLRKSADVRVAAGKTSDATRSSACKVLPRGATGVPAMRATCTSEFVTSNQVSDVVGSLVCRRSGFRVISTPPGYLSRLDSRSQSRDWDICAPLSCLVCTLVLSFCE